MSTDIICGLIEKSDVTMIVLKKIQMILLAVAAQSLSELKEFKKQHKIKQLSQKQCTAWTLLERNLDYLVEMIEPMVLKLKIFEGFERPLREGALMEAYRKTAEELRPLEKYVIPTYNSEPQLSQLGVEWCGVEQKYIKM